ncbi:fatty acyl-CoA reductase, partial [Nocardia sp. NPDC060220]
SPEWAAGTIVRALTERPKRIDVPLGTLAEYGGIITPKLRDRILHRYYRALPDSPAAKGESAEDTPAPAPAPRADPKTPSAARKATGTALRRAARWVPGTHW